MPIYEFHCKECRNDFKRLCRSELRDALACPACGAERVVKVLSVTARGSSEDVSAGGACGMPATGGCCGLSPNGCGCRN